MPWFTRVDSQSRSHSYFTILFSRNKVSTTLSVRGLCQLRGILSVLTFNCQDKNNQHRFNSILTTTNSSVLILHCEIQPRNEDRKKDLRSFHGPPLISFQRNLWSFEIKISIFRQNIPACFIGHVTTSAILIINSLPICLIIQYLFILPINISSTLLRIIKYINLFQGYIYNEITIRWNILNQLEIN